MDGWRNLSFDVARVEAGVAHYLHSFRRNMGNHAGDKVESGAGNGDTLTGGSVSVPVGDGLAIIVSDAGGSQGRVAQVTADVFGGIEALGIEAVSVDLVATVVTVSLLYGLSKCVVVGTSLAEMLAQ